MFSALSFPALAEDAVIPENVPVQDNPAPPPVETPPVTEAPQAPTSPPEITPEIQTDKPADAATTETKIEVTPERYQSNSQGSKKPDNRNRHDRDSKRNDWDKDRNHSHRPRVVYRRAPPKIVYIYPQSYYPTTSYYETYTSYPSGYEASYHVGGYLPPEREWRALPDFVRYGLPAPRRGELWVYNDRDAVLINDKTSRIISGFVLAAPVD